MISHTFADECARAIQDETYNEDQKRLVLGNALLPFDISERCATLGVGFDSIPVECRRASSYALGCVAADNLEEFIRFEREVDYPPKALYEAGKHCSRRVMQHYGFGDDQLPFYTEGAILGCNKETLQFLLPYGYVQKDWYYSLKKSDPRFAFVVECYREGLLRLSESARNYIQNNYPLLYQELEENV